MNYLKIFALFFIYFFSIENVFAEKYFGYDSVSPMMIDKPFEMNSQQHKDEIKQVILMQKNLEPQELDLALKEKQLRPETVVQHVNKKLTRQKFPNLYALYYSLQKVRQSSMARLNRCRNIFQQNLFRLIKNK
jgi:hypothetical protein